LTALPLRVEEVGEQELAQHEEIHLVTVSFPCQGMLRANRNALRMEDHRSKCVEEAWRILTRLLERQARPPGYTFEMVDARNHPSAKAREGFATFVQMAAGDSDGIVAVDAAELDSPAYRVRVFCTKLALVKGIRERYAACNRGNGPEGGPKLPRFRTNG
jgi:site-specific DNA-cytosine methylase